MVAEELNFRSAADKLHVSHPALSKQIKDLEYELGVRLLERNTVSAWLTDAGRQFLKDSRDILARVEQAVAAAKSESGGDNSLVMATAGPFWDAVLHGLLKRFRHSHPNVEIRMVEKKPWTQIAALQRGEFQIGFVGKQNTVTPRSTLCDALILKSPFGVVMSVDHPLARLKELHWADIQNEKIYHLGAGRASHHLQDIRNILPKGKLSSQQVKGVDGIDALVTMITSCQGISMLPQAFVDSRKNTVRFIPLADARAECQFQLWAVWRKDDTSKALQSFVELLQAQAKAV